MWPAEARCNSLVAYRGKSLKTAAVSAAAYLSFLPVDTGPDVAAPTVPTTSEDGPILPPIDSLAQPTQTTDAFYNMNLPPRPSSPLASSPAPLLPKYHNHPAKILVYGSNKDKNWSLIYDGHTSPEDQQRPLGYGTIWYQDGAIHIGEYDGLMVKDGTPGIFFGKDNIMDMSVWMKNTRVGEGVLWNNDRSHAYRMLNGQRKEEIPLNKAMDIANRFHFRILDLPPKRPDVSSAETPKS